MNLLPPIVSLLAWALLGEALGLHQLLGGGLALLGVTLGLRPPR
jgi:drug/metabolite transporter (DMT)-like permease